jgi:hypothetical protein
VTAATVSTCPSWCVDHETSPNGRTLFHHSQPSKPRAANLTVQATLCDDPAAKGSVMVLKHGEPIEVLTVAQALRLASALCKAMAQASEPTA